MTQIMATVFQYPDITGIEFEIDGERWCGWETLPCEEVPVPRYSRADFDAIVAAARSGE